MAASKQTKLPFKPRLTRGQRREKILLAAEELFAQRGYDATSLNEVGAAAGITKAVIYDHFASKPDLYMAVLEEKAAELVAHIYARMDQVDESLPAEESLRVAIHAFLSFVGERPFAWKLLFRDPPPETAIAEAYMALRQTASDAVAQRLARHPAAQAAGLGPGDPRIAMAAGFLEGGLAGIVSWWYLHREIPADRVVDAVMQLAWPGLAALAESL
jgi:AcrR family transcriptional regulator